MYTSVECAGCRVSFQKKSTEYRRSEKYGRLHYCSLRCSGRFSPLVTDRERFDRAPIPRRYKDDLSPFRPYLTRIRNRKKEYKITVTLDDLRRTWEAQNGQCPLTGWELELSYPGSLCHPRRASLDRIDSSKGYEVDNIRWVCVLANWCKNGFTDEEVIEFCKAVASRL